MPPSQENTMNESNRSGLLFLGVSLFLGLATLGYLLGDAAIRFKELERTVTVKGLSEREFPADIVIWPIQFTAAGNDLADLYLTIDDNAAKIRRYLEAAGIDAAEVSTSAPAITDRSAQQYGNRESIEFRYAAVQTVTVYSENIATVRKIMGGLSELGRQGIVFSGGNYQSQTEYLFTRLNEVKPDMIEEATRKAREVAEKFAADSDSRLGKIRTASQGQFSISDRDKNNPHIKKVRVVSTVVYYLSD
jgi:hypothetical protein